MDRPQIIEKLKAEFLANILERDIINEGLSFHFSLDQGHFMSLGICRRRFLASLGVATVAIGCSDDSAKRAALFKASALVSVQIGERLVRLQHPALRITGIVLVLTGELIVIYLQMNDAAEIKETFRVTPDEVAKLEQSKLVTLVREDGKIEPFPIGEVKSSP